jgi:predicted PurR-regulated permease PerM
VLTLAVVAVIAGARVAEPFLVPVITGILLAYTLRPLVAALERVHIGRVIGAALVIVVLAGSLSAVAYMIRDDVNAAVAELPAAARKLRLAAADAARQPEGPMTHMKAAALELDRAAAEATGKRVPPPEPSSNNMAGQLQTFVSEQSAKALVVLGEVLVAILLTFFLLAAGDTFRRKCASLAGVAFARRRITVELLNEIDAQVQAYMVTLLVANVLIALATWGAMAMLDLPNAGMWGVFAGVVHVIPYAGTAVTAAAVGVAMFVHSGSVAEAALAAAIVTGLAVLIGMVLTTWMQGRASRINPVAVFVGILFFGWLWGGWGLLLGMPILAVVKTIADRVEALRPLSEFLAA